MTDHGHRAKIVPGECLNRLKQDIDDLKNGSKSGYYDFNVPDLDFEVNSLIIVASKSSRVLVNFTVDGEKIPLNIPPSYADMYTISEEMEKNANDFLAPKGNHVKIASKLPLKILAVRSGLCIYGRNNICYREDMGSFLRLTALYSDIKCDEANWYELRQMDSCKKCTICLNMCPTKAITKESHLIKRDRCLTLYNENEGDFPDWIDYRAHNSIVGCIRCQENCPHNKEFKNDIIESVDFSEEESKLLIDGEPLEKYPEPLLEKMRALGMMVYASVISRNLKVLLNATQGCQISNQ